MRQGEIDWEPPTNGTETSGDAAESMKPHTARLRQQIYTMIVCAGPYGLTCDEIEVASGLSHQTASARVNELMRLGDIEAAGRRKTRSGRTAFAWVVA